MIDEWYFRLKDLDDDQDLFLGFKDDEIVCFDKNCTKNKTAFVTTCDHVKKAYVTKSIRKILEKKKGTKFSKDLINKFSS